MKRFIFLVCVLSLLMSSCGVPPTSKNGYEVILPTGETKFLDYQYCKASTDAGIFQDQNTLFVVCGHWSTNNTYTATLVVEYKAQVLSFEAKDGG